MNSSFGYLVSLSYSAQQVHLHFQTKPVLWTPGRRSALGWWAPTGQVTYPLTDLTPSQNYILPCPPRPPHRAHWLNFARAVGPRWGVADVSHWMRHRATCRADNMVVGSPQQQRTLWLTGLAGVTGRRGSFPVGVTPFKKQVTTWNTNRPRRWATRWTPRLLRSTEELPTVTELPEKRSVERNLCPRLRTIVLPRRPRRWGWRIRKSLSLQLRAGWASWVRFLWSSFSFSIRLRHHFRLVHKRERGGLYRRRYVGLDETWYLWVNDPPRKLVRRPFVSRRRWRRWRRWYPATLYWRAATHRRRRLKVYPRRQGYLGLPCRLGLPLPNKIRWWRRPTAPAVPLVRATSVLCLHWQTRWRSRRRRYRRRGVWRQGLTFAGSVSHQQRWPLPATSAPTHLRRLASLLVCRARRWTTEGVARRLQRRGGWSRLYLLGYTSVGYRTQIKAGAAVKVPAVLSSVKSLVLLRRWLTRAAAAAGGRTWSERVTAAVTHPTGVTKQRQEFITTALAGAARL